MNLPQFITDEIIEHALHEDINYVDVATDYLLDDDDISTARFVAKASGVLCGIDIAIRTFEMLDKDISTQINIKDGGKVNKGDVIAVVTGKTKAILKAERTALNILQHMSGIASETAKYAECCKGTNAHVTETRKTLPGLRAIEKYAVTVGGGKNHRYNLSDAAMLKDNHIDAYGSITKAVEALRSKIGHMVKIEVEVRNEDELREALGCNADIIMLDNMTCEQMKKCVEIANGKAVLEASGNVTLENMAEVAATGVDIVSVGALTHSVKAFDISLKIDKK